MTRISHCTLLASAALCLSACGSPPPGPAATVTVPAAQNAQLGLLVERYWADLTTLSPWYSWGGVDLPAGEIPSEIIAPQALADALAIERRYLSAVSAIPRASLNPRSALTYDIFRRGRLSAIEGFTYPQELIPVNPYVSMPQQFAFMAAGAERLALSSRRDFDNWRLRSQSFGRWTQQAIQNMRDGLRRGYTVPRVLIEKMLPELAALGADTPSNVFNLALTATGAGGAATGVGGAAASTSSEGGGTGGETEKARLATAAHEVIGTDILPAYRALHDFLQKEYLPRSRTTVGLSALPLGDAWYAYLVRRAAGSGADEAHLHTMGTAEVERLQQRMRALLAEASFAGDAQAYFDHLRADARFSFTEPTALLDAYKDLKTKAATAAPSLVVAVPRADFGVRAADAYWAAVAAPLTYRPRAPNGIIAAVLYVNTAGVQRGPVVLLPAQFLREAVPGHHYQLELQHERADLPRFRRFGMERAFVEGWAMYAVGLGDEMGMYRDPEAKFSALLVQLECAAGVVIDTGLHAQGWTREQALDYVHAKVPMAVADAEETVDRAIALPGAALSCMAGEAEFRALRAWAEHSAGANFDERGFHTELLRDGSMPLDLLDAKMHAWVPTPPVVAAPAAADGAAATSGSAASAVVDATAGAASAAVSVLR